MTVLKIGGGVLDGLNASEDSSGMTPEPPMPLPEFLAPEMTKPSGSVVPLRKSRTSLPVRALSVVWAVIPIATLGLGAPFTFTFAAIRLRSRVIGLCAGAYGVVAGASLILLGIGSDTSWEGNVGFAIGTIAGAVATGQAFAIRKRLLDPASDEGRVVALATEQMRLREKARKIVAKNPSLAHELQIGRPEFHRRFDDGGLVDVNHVPVDYLTQLPGIDQSIAQRI